MWIYCKSGFFSAVEHFEKPGVIHVRARFEGDLERLCEKHGITPCVSATPHNDYKWRMDFPKAEWARIVKEEAEAIDYANFKNAVHDGTVRDIAYMETWAAMRDAQENAARRGRRQRR